MPVVSTEVLELLKSLGLDEAKALRAAAAVGEARIESDGASATELRGLRLAIGGLREGLTADMAALRDEVATALDRLASDQEAARDALTAALRTELDVQRKAAAVAEVANRKALEEAAAAQGALKWLVVALIGLSVIGIIIGIVV